MKPKSRATLRKGLSAAEAGKAESEKKGSQRQPFNPADWITKAEAARIRKVTRQAIGKLVEKGKFETLEIAGNVFLKKSDVESYKPEPGGRPAGRK